MEIKPFKDNNYIRLLEKFTDILGIHFDSIHALSELEIFRRKQTESKDIDPFDELLFWVKNLEFTLQKNNPQQKKFFKKYHTPHRWLFSQKNLDGSF